MSAENIKKLREAKGIQQGELAKWLGVTQAAISNWETGVSMPRTQYLVPLAHELGCTVDDLLRDTE